MLAHTEPTSLQAPRGFALTRGQPPAPRSCGLTCRAALHALHPHVAGAALVQHGPAGRTEVAVTMET